MPGPPLRGKGGEDPGRGSDFLEASSCLALALSLHWLLAPRASPRALWAPASLTQTSDSTLIKILLRWLRLLLFPFCFVLKYFKADPTRDAILSSVSSRARGS